jgi:hypothetical protein
VTPLFHTRPWLFLFMASVVVTWAVKPADHAGLLHWHEPPGVAR